MTDVVRFALLGLGLGALYSLASQGLIVTYRGSGVLNFAHGAIGMMGAFIAWELQGSNGAGYATAGVHAKGLPFAVAAVIGVGAAAALGGLTHVLVMRPLRRASPLARIVATLGILVIVQATAIIRYGSDAYFIKSELPQNLVRLFGVAITIDRFILLAIAIALTLALWWIYHRSSFGLATTAVAENQRTAAGVGLSPDTIATVNWMLGSGLAAVAAILISPIVSLQVSQMTTLVLASLAAALVASFRSFPIALFAGLGLGILQSEAQRFTTTPGLPQSLPFMVIIVVMVVRGRSIPLRDFFLQRMPLVGNGRVRPLLLLFGIAVSALMIQTLPPVWVDSLTTTFAVGLILLSIVVVTGYAGQLSLAQVAIGGFGAWIAGRLVAAEGWPLWAGALAGIAGAAMLGVVFAVPSLRTRGINLAIVTLGLGTAIELMIFNNGDLVGGFTGTEIGSPHLFGWDINDITHTNRYAYVSLGAFVVVSLVVASMRRGRSGRRLLAVRTNERAATALGISVRSAKLYAFALAAAIAAVGGILLGFRNPDITYSAFYTNFSSISDIGWAVIGGIGYLMGPVFGATLAPSAIGTRIGDVIFPGLDNYVQLIGGCIVVLMVLGNQDGIAKENIKQMRALVNLVKKNVPALRRHERVRGTTVRVSSGLIEKVQQQVLEIQGMSVHFGGVVALDDVSLTVRPGEVLGLIGPNGAGKTTLIDAVTAFTPPLAGRLLLNGRDIRTWSATKRARAGISRSFQGLELFEDLTVLDNLRAASDPRDTGSYFRDLIYPINPPLPTQVEAAIKEFGLENDLDRPAHDLPYGQRRLLAIARAVATEPSVLLLDEPAAGLSEVESRDFGHLVRRLAVDWGMAVLLVEHDMQFVMSVCDRIAVLDFGRKIAEGLPEAVRADPAVIAAYLGKANLEERSRQPAVAVSQSDD